jgi:hypothetical protein
VCCGTDGGEAGAQSAFGACDRGCTARWQRAAAIRGAIIVELRRPARALRDGGGEAGARGTFDRGVLQSYSPTPPSPSSQTCRAVRQISTAILLEP